VEGARLILKWRGEPRVACRTAASARPPASGALDSYFTCLIPKQVHAGRERAHYVAFMLLAARRSSGVGNPQLKQWSVWKYNPERRRKKLFLHRGQQRFRSKSNPKPNQIPNPTMPAPEPTNTAAKVADKIFMMVGDKTLVKVSDNTDAKKPIANDATKTPKHT
jgi:hypothetical protein